MFHLFWFCSRWQNRCKGDPDKWTLSPTVLIVALHDPSEARHLVSGKDIRPGSRGETHCLQRHLPTSPDRKRLSCHRFATIPPTIVRRIVASTFPAMGHSRAAGTGVAAGLVGWSFCRGIGAVSPHGTGAPLNAPRCGGAASDTRLPEKSKPPLPGIGTPAATAGEPAASR